jgi:hypothetical protein
MDARVAQYTESRVRLLVRSLLRALLFCAASGSCLFGSLLPPCVACRGVDEALPRLVWWRAGARAGVLAAEAFANQSPVS